MSWLYLGVSAASLGMQYYASTQDNDSGGGNMGNRNGALDALLNMPQPADRDVANEYVNNFEAAAGVSDRYRDAAHDQAMYLGDARRTTWNNANPELAHLLSVQDQGVNLDRVDPNMFLAGGAGAATGGGYRYSPIQAALAMAPEDIQVRDVYAQQLAQLEQSGLLTQMNDQAMNQDYSQITQVMEQQALGDLALGRSLSSQQQRDAQQSARAAYNARGLYSSNAAIADEILNLDRVATEREAQRRAFAGSVAQQQLAELEGMRGYSTAVEGLNQGVMGMNNQRDLANQSSDLQAQLGNQNADLQSGIAEYNGQLQVNLGNQSALNEFAMYNSQQATAAARAGASAAAANNAANYQRYMQAVGFNNDASLAEYDVMQQAVGNRERTAYDPMAVMMDFLNPQSQYAANVHAQNYEGAWSGYNADQNALAAIYSGQMQNNAANSQANASMMGGLFQGLGSFAGGLFCWVARAAYGVEDPRWRIWRAWLLEHAPKWLRVLYLRRGPGFAQWLDGRTPVRALARAVVRGAMNFAVRYMGRKGWDMPRVDRLEVELGYGGDGIAWEWR